MAAHKRFCSNSHALSRERRLAHVVGLAALLLASACRGDDGRDLYERGNTAAGAALSARTGADGSWVLRGAAVACANCHGLEGRGGGEGYQRAPDLRWPQWASPDPTSINAARQRLRNALQHGQAPEARQLSPAMPRFDLDERSLDALARHLVRLTTEQPGVPIPRLALLRMDDAHASTTEAAVATALERCLQTRLGGRVVIEQATASSPEQARQTWQRWQSRPDIIAALAPPWRGWQVPEPQAGESALPALFPLVADPRPGGPPSTHWLFGGAEARLAALTQAWLSLHGADRSVLPVWAGAQGTHPQALALLARTAEVVQQDTGRSIAWTLLTTPALPTGQSGVWLDDTREPSAGWWLVPTAAEARSQTQGRWWMAVPYAGAPPRPLAQRWAESVCRTTEAALASDANGANAPLTDRAQWIQAVSRTPRLRDAHGWEWQPPARDAAGYGASTAWTIVQFTIGAPSAVIVPLVNISRPAEPTR
jgi:hypothetical protein